MSAQHPLPSRSFGRLGFLLALGCLLGLMPLAARQGGPRSGAETARDAVTRADARRLLEKVSTIENHAAVLVKPGRGMRSAGTARTTLVTEREVNSYLAFEAGPQIPVGIAQPRIRILGDRRLSGTALVDLDAVRAQHKATGWFDPMSYLTGRLPVAVSGSLQAAGGVARFNLESATISSVPIPKTLLQELLTYYSRTPDNPRGLNLDDPFQLPARIRQIDVRAGEAVVVQ